MDLKFGFCYMLILFSMSNSNAVDVKCIDEGTGNTCFIKETINVESGDDLNIVDVTNPKEVNTIYFAAENRKISSKIVSFPSSLFEQFPSLEHLLLSNVSMESLIKENFGNAKMLYSLNVTLNKIKMISENIITLAPKLELLYLSGNEISEIEDYAFNSSSLRELHLSENKLKSIKSFTFSNASQCEVIDLSANFIETIEEGAFDLLELKTVILDKNNLRILPENIFANTPKLLRLNIGANQLATEIVTALEKAKGLMDLYLYDNPTLEEVSLLFLRQFPNLKTLDLSNTRLTIGTIEHLQNLPTLTHLSIARNNLTDSNLLHHLGHLKSLKRLHIQGNEFTTLDDFNRITSIIPSLWSIQLNDNPWDGAWMESAKRTCKLSSAYCHGMP